MGATPSSTTWTSPRRRGRVSTTSRAPCCPWARARRAGPPDRSRALPSRGDCCRPSAPLERYPRGDITTTPAALTRGANSCSSRAAYLPLGARPHKPARATARAVPCMPARATHARTHTSSPGRPPLYVGRSAAAEALAPLRVATPPHPPSLYGPAGAQGYWALRPPCLAAFPVL